MITIDIEMLCHKRHALQCRGHLQFCSRAYSSNLFFVFVLKIRNTTINDLAVDMIINLVSQLST